MANSMLDAIVLAREAEHLYKLDQLTSKGIGTLVGMIDDVKQELKPIISNAGQMAGVFKVERAEKLMAQMNQMNLGIAKKLGMNISSVVSEAGIESIKTHNDIFSFGGRVQAFNNFSLSPVQIKSLVDTTPVGGSLLNDWVKKTFDANLVEKIRRDIGKGMLEGQGMSQIAKRFHDGYEMVKRDIATLTRTYVQSINVTALEGTYKANSDLIKRLRWCATLESSYKASGHGTCLSCAAMDGLEFPIEEHPPCPLHPNCRCILLPVTATWEELGLNIGEIEQVYRPYVMRGDKAVGVGGKPYYLQIGFSQKSYADWFSVQSLSFMKNALGPARYELYITKQFDFRDFVDLKTGRVYPLEEIAPAKAKKRAMMKRAQLKAQKEKEALELKKAEEEKQLIANHFNPDGVAVYTKDTKLPAGMFEDVDTPDLVHNPDIWEPPIPKGEKISAGVIMFDEDTGKVWIFEPKGHFGGYEHSFPKGTWEKGSGLSLQKTAIKEVWEETGLQAEIYAHLGDYQKKTGITRYYVGKMVKGNPTKFGDETFAVKFVSLDEAEKLLNTEIDKKILKDMKNLIEQVKFDFSLEYATGAVELSDAFILHNKNLAKLMVEKAKKEALEKAREEAVKEIVEKAAKKARANTFTQAKTIDEAVEWVKKNYSDKTICQYDGANLELINAIHNQLDYLKKTYGTLADGILEINFQTPLAPGGVLVTTYGPGEFKIFYSSLTKHLSLDEVGRLMSSGMGRQSFEWALQHEFGTIISSQIKTYAFSYDENLYSFFNDAVTHVFNTMKLPSKNASISMTNCFGECFAEMNLKPMSQWSEGTKAIYDMFKEMEDIYGYKVFAKGARTFAEEAADEVFTLKTLTPKAEVEAIVRAAKKEVLGVEIKPDTNIPVPSPRMPKVTLAEKRKYITYDELNKAEKQQISQVKAKIKQGLIPNPKTAPYKTWVSLDADSQAKILQDLVKKGHSIPDNLPVRDEVKKKFFHLFEVKSVEDTKDFINFDDFVKYESQKGSNWGGFYHHKNNPAERYYIKVPSGEDIANNEILASHLYREAGVEVPVLKEVVVNGKKGVASRIVDGVKKNSEALTNGTIREGVYDNFVVDCWLGNWDVVGTGYDNLLIIDGVRGIRIDVGGSLRYRAMGGLKSASQWNNTVGELESMMKLMPDGSNRYSVSVFKNITTEELERGVQKVISISDERIRELCVKYSGLKGAELETLANTLIARKKYIADKFPHVKPLTKKLVKEPVPIAKTITDKELQLINDSKITGYAVRIDKKDIEDQKVLFFTDVDEKGNKRVFAHFKLYDQKRRDFLASVARSANDMTEMDDTVISMSLLDQHIESAIKGIGAQSNAGNPLRFKDIERCNRAFEKYREMYDSLKNEIGKTIAKEEFQRFEDHYRKILDVLRKVVETGEDNMFAWDKDKYQFVALGHLNKIVKAPVKTGIQWKKVNSTFRERELVNGDARATGKNIHLGRGYTSYYGSRYEANIDGLEIRVWKSEGQPGRKAINYAMDGKVEIMAVGSLEEGSNKILEAMKKLGINNSRATAEDIEELYLKQIFYARKDSDFDVIIAEAEKIADQNKRLEYLQTTLANKMNITRKQLLELPSYNPHGEYQTYGHGRTFAFRPDLEGPEWDSFEQNYILTHALHADPYECMKMILESGGHMAPTTEKLMRLGRPWGGMSPDDDMATGGANYFFTRIAKKEHTKGYVGLFWKPRLLKRLDAISYTSDHFGNTTEGFVWDHRKTDIKGFIECSRNWRMDGGCETIFKESLSIFDDLECIRVPGESYRNKMIKLFRDHLKSDRFPDGRLIEEVVLTTE